MTLIVQGQRMNQALNQLSQTLSATAQVAVENVQLKNEVTTAEKRLDTLGRQFAVQQFVAGRRIRHDSDVGVVALVAATGVSNGA